MTFVSSKGRHQEGSFVFASRPKPIGSRSKFREAQENVCENIMFDRRVVRGNTYAQHIIPIPKPEIQRPKKSGKRATGPKRGRELYRPKTPEPVPGRAHVELQTELYLEELREAVVTTDVCCQTDAALDRPTSPLFIPAKSGVDTDTQIEEGELFDFDREVQPVLEVLVGKTIEQSLLEVMEEEELACLRAQQRAFQELRNNEMAEVQRLQEKDRRLREEKERRIAQQREVLKKEKETAEKIAARAYTQSYLAGLLPAVYSSLTSHGYFYNPMERDLDTNFFPWLLEEVHKRLEKRHIARQMLDTLIHDATQKRLEDFRLL